VDVVEQNVHDSIWPEGVQFSRRLPAKRSSSGAYEISCTYSDAEVLGWMNLHLDELLAPAEQ
jgi:glutathionylspermidine amidase/synthetase